MLHGKLHNYLWHFMFLSGFLTSMGCRSNNRVFFFFLQQSNTNAERSTFIYVYFEMMYLKSAFIIMDYVWLMEEMTAFIV